MARALTDHDRARGERAAEIRDRLGRLTQEAMTEKLNDTARQLGLPATYRYYTVSRMERGTISFEDAAVLIALDPERRGWDWFVRGEPTASAPAASPKRYVPPEEAYQIVTQSKQAKRQRPPRRRRNG